MLSQTEIISLLECEICNQKYDINEVPMLIPCGKSACFKCVSRIEVDLLNRETNTFKCLDDTCTETHPLPKNGLPTNKKLAELIRMLKLKRAQLINPLLNEMDLVESLINEISADLYDSQFKLKKYCDQIRHSIHAATEEKIKDINELSESLVKIVDEYENECSLKFGKLNKFKANLDKMIQDANKFLLDRREYLNQLEISDAEIQISTELAKEYKFYLDRQKSYIEKLIFDYKIVEFKANPDKLSEMSIGFICSQQLENTLQNDIKETNNMMSSKAVNLDDGCLISGSWDNSIKLWNAKTGELLNTLESHDGIVFCLQVISKNLLISGSSDEKIKLWNLETGECVATLLGHTSSVICLNLVPNEMPIDTLISGSWDKTIKIWSLSKRLCLNTLIGHKNGIMSIQVVSSESLISASSDHKIKIWNFKTGKCIKTLHGHTDGVSCIKILNDTLISASNDNTIKLWSLNRKSVSTLDGHQNSVFCVEIISCELIVSGSADGLIKIWNVDTNECVSTLEGHEGIVFCLQIVKDDSILISGSYDASVKIWNYIESKCIFSLTGHNASIHCLQLLSNETIASGSADNTIKVWNIKSGELINTLMGHSHYLSCFKLFKN